MAFLFAFSPVACSDDDDEEEATETGTCNGVAVFATCTEFEGDPSFIDEERQSCEDNGDTWTTEACPTADLVGCCRESFGSDELLDCYYTAYGQTALELEETCVLFEGTWTTGGRG